MTDALRKFLYEKDALGTATVIEVTPADLEALVEEATGDFDEAVERELDNYEGDCEQVHAYDDYEYCN